MTCLIVMSTLVGLAVATIGLCRCYKHRKTYKQNKVQGETAGDDQFNFDRAIENKTEPITFNVQIYH